MPDSSAKKQSLDLVKQVKRKSHLPPPMLLFCFPALASPYRAVFHKSSWGGSGIHRHNSNKVLNLSVCSLKWSGGNNILSSSCSFHLAPQLSSLFAPQ